MNVDAQWGKHLRRVGLIVALTLLHGTAGAECQLDQIILTLDEALYGCTECQGIVTVMAK